MRLSSLLAASFALAAQAQDAPSYRDELVSFHKSLVDIPSISGNESAVGEFLIEYLTEKGFATQRQFLPASNSTNGTERFNVIAWPEPRPSNWSRVLVSTHMDVVPPYLPYTISGPDPPTAETVIGGRGTVDAKGAAAAQVVALLELLTNDTVTGDDVMLVFVVGEEAGGVGMMHYSDELQKQPASRRPRVGIFGEPTEATLPCGHKGALGCTIQATGKSGHSGYPETGLSANEILMRAMVKAIDADLGSSDLFGNTTLNVGLIEGGIAINVIPDAATAGIAARVAVGPESTGHEFVQARLQEVLDSVNETAFELDCTLGYGAVALDCDIDGFETATVNYGTDIPLLQGNHTRYLYGPGSILVAHTQEEAITLGELEQAVEDYKTLIVHAVEKAGRY